MELNRLYAKVFKWMGLGLLVSFLTAFMVSSNETMMYNLFSGSMIWFIVGIELLLVLGLSFLINKLSYMSALIWFFLYCFVSGLTMSGLCYTYSLGSLFITFIATSVMFGVMALIGNKTNKDLSKIGTILLFSLIPIIIVSIINIFIGSTLIDFILSIVIVLVFCGITAYDMQNIKRLFFAGHDENKIAVIGALELYLDYINIFIQMLQFIGKQK